MAVVVGLALLAGCRKDGPKPGAPAAAPAAVPPAELPTAATPQSVAGAKNLPDAAVPVAGRIEVAVTEEGFVPDRIKVKAGEPVTMIITRRTEKTCANEILFQGHEGKTDLPLNQAVVVTYTPQVQGKVKFGCAMGMMIGGVLEVRD